MSVAFDFKREYRALYQPSREPALIEVPPMNFVAVEGRGDPNAPDGDYQRALSVLYGVSYTIRMSKRGGRRIEGYFDYVVPPLEGFWWMPGEAAMDFARKADFCWLSAIRLPDFVTAADFDWAVAEASRRKGLDCGAARFTRIGEGLCAQVMHVGPYDDEPETIARLSSFIRENGCAENLTETRRHHEIYLSDPRRTAPEKMKTVIRTPVRMASPTSANSLRPAR